MYATGGQQMFAQSIDLINEQGNGTIEMLDKTVVAAGPGLCAWIWSAI